MAKKRALILGAGISGLSLAWYLSRNSDSWEILLLEKTERAGGWMRSERRNGFFFERGPHTFSSKRSWRLGELAIELGLEGEIINSNDRSRRRYLYLDGALRPCPKWPLIKSLWHEWRTPPKKEGDESIYQFACRRFSREVADTLFDAMTLGVHAGDMHQLSLPSCFPFFRDLERRYDSITKGMLARFFQKRPARPSTLFSFQRGVGSMVEALNEAFSGQIHYGQEVRQLHFTDSGVAVETQDRHFTADHLFCALPAPQARALFAPNDPRLGELLDIPMQHFSALNLAYARALLPKRGFGYLVPTSERGEIFGVLFDSEIFPQQSSHPQETRLTVMMPSRPDCEEAAKRALKKHLGISADPDALLVTESVLPQFVVGHAARIALVQERMASHFPRGTLVGNYLEGVSVSDCIALSQKTANAFRCA